MQLPPAIFSRFSSSALVKITPVGEEMLEQFEANIVVDGDRLVAVAPC